MHFLGYLHHFILLQSHVLVKRNTMKKPNSFCRWQIIFKIQFSDIELLNAKFSNFQYISIWFLSWVLKLVFFLSLTYQQNTTIYGSQLIIFGQTLHSNNAYEEQLNPFEQIINLFILHSDYLTMSHNFIIHDDCFWTCNKRQSHYVMTYLFILTSFLLHSWMI